MVIRTAILSTAMYFSFSQFMVFDKSVTLPGCAWTEAHFRQGFARRSCNVNFGTLMESGYAELNIYAGPYEYRSNYRRVIEVPILVSSGEVAIEGPEEVGVRRLLRIANGHYRLTAAQAVTANNHEAIDLYFQMASIQIMQSRIILADDALFPQAVLIESADVA